MRKLILFFIFNTTVLITSVAQNVQRFTLPSIRSNKWEDFSEKIYISIEKQARFLLRNVHNWEKDKNLKLLTDSQVGENGIRPNTGSVAGFAFLYHFGNYDQSITGISRKQLLNDIIIPMMRYLVRTHLTGNLTPSDGKQWGNAWQSAHWTHELAKGAWWIWDDLPKDIQEGVRNIVKYEASRFYKIEPPYRLRYNTASEENAWNSQIFHAALLLMPEDKDVPLWKKLLKIWIISSYIRPADLKSDVIIDSIKLSSFKGANIYDDYTLENHGIVHLDYLGCFILTFQFALDYTMQNRQTPDYIFFNIKEIYENLKWFVMPDGGFIYPSGQDWQIYCNPDWLIHHCLAAAFLHDPDAPELARRVLECTEKMQQRNPEGNVYTKEENPVITANTDLFFYSALSWLTMSFMSNTQDDYTEKKGTKIFESGKIVINRTPTSIHSLSWGSKIMFQSIAKKYDRVFDSDMYNGIGYIVLNGESDVLPITLGKDFKIQIKNRQFKAKYSVNHGSNIVAFYKIRSCNKWIEVSEKLVAIMSVSTQTIATSCFGILNNTNWIYEKGLRTISNDKGNMYNFSSGQGYSERLNSKELILDDTVLFHSNKTMESSYKSASQYKHSRITDHLILNHLNGERTWEKGQVISQTDYKIIIQ